MRCVVAAPSVKGKMCKAAYYLGEYELLQRRADSALSLLRQAIEICPDDFIERDLALAEKMRMDQAR